MGLEGRGSVLRERHHCACDVHWPMSHDTVKLTLPILPVSSIGGPAHPHPGHPEVSAFCCASKFIAASLRMPSCCSVQHVTCRMTIVQSVEDVHVRSFEVRVSL